MIAILAAHVSGGIVAIIAGALAIAVRKGSRIHRLAGSWFFVSMLLLGVTATILAWLDGGEFSLGIGGILTCYFVATSWVAARRHDGTTGNFEIIVCAVALGAAAALTWTGLTAVTPPTPVGVGPVFALAGVCLLAGLLDLSAILRGRLTPVQRLSRHLWRMCFAFFIATGSFFLGQQDVLPEAVRGSPILFVLAFAPLAIMLFWLVRIRLAKVTDSLQRLLRQGAAPVTGA